jgi:hypothetical protein
MGMVAWRHLTPRDKSRQVRTLLSRGSQGSHAREAAQAGAAAGLCVSDPGAGLGTGGDSLSRQEMCHSSTDALVSTVQQGLDSWWPWDRFKTPSKLCGGGTRLKGGPHCQNPAPQVPSENPGAPVHEGVRQSRRGLGWPLMSTCQQTADKITKRQAGRPLCRQGYRLFTLRITFRRAVDRVFFQK